MEVQNVVRGIEFHEKVKDLVNGPMRTRGGLVDFVDDDDDRKIQSKCLLQNEVGLRHGPFLRIDEEQCAVSHLKYALNLPAEIGMTGRVNDVDAVPFIVESAIFRGNRDAALAFQVHRVHEALFHRPVLPVHPALLE